MYVDFIEPCFGIGHNLSLICQMTSEDIKHQLIIIINQNQDYRFETHLFSSRLVWLDIILMHLLDHLSAIKKPQLCISMSKKKKFDFFLFLSLHTFLVFINLWSNSLQKTAHKKKRKKGHHPLEKTVAMVLNLYILTIIKEKAAAIWLPDLATTG